MQTLRHLGPEGVRLFLGPGGKPRMLGGINVGRLCEGVTRLKEPGFLQHAGDVVGHKRALSSI
jgi:hypothetical protein